MVREGLKIENVCVCVCCTVFVNVCPPLQVARLQESLTEAKSESAVLREKVAAMTTTLEQQRQSDEEEREGLKKRADGLTQQNSLLHEEAEKMAARIITLQEQGRSETTPTVSVTMGTVATETESSTDQLWEIIRSVCINGGTSLTMTLLLLHLVSGLERFTVYL